jgi:RNA polymerase sigma-70 factor (ECF subfamily)
MSKVSGQSAAGTGPARFVSTAWTTIVRAQNEGSANSRRCLDLLMQRYWRPVYHFLRHLGRSHDDASDLTQGFFVRFIEKDAIRYADRERGRFRSFLIGSVKRYLAMEHRAAAARPDEVPVTDFASALQERPFGGGGVDDPETAFTRNWLKCTVENALSILRKECVALGRPRQFQAFRARFLGGEARPASYREISLAMGISEKDVENLLASAKKRFRRIFLEEIRNATSSAGDAQQEVRELLEVLG